MTLAARTAVGGGAPARDSHATPHRPHGAGKPRRPHGGPRMLGGGAPQVLGALPGWGFGPKPLPSLGAATVPSAQVTTDPDTHTQASSGRAAQGMGEDCQSQDRSLLLSLTPEPPGGTAVPTAGQPRLRPRSIPGAALGVRACSRVHVRDCGAVTWGSGMQASSGSWIPTACSGPTAETSGSP